MASAAKINLAPVGSTGNNTHLGVHSKAANAQVGFQFTVEAIGATPTVTWKYQGSVDNVNFYDIFYVTDASDTATAATRVETTVISRIQWLSRLALTRQYTYYRLVTSANTNVTYSADMWIFEKGV